MFHSCNSWLLTFIILPLFIAILWKQMFESTRKTSFETRANDDKKLLKIGILSARDNFKQRIAIRETWLSKSEMTDALSYKFVVGNSDCNVHPNNRKVVYSCESQDMRIPEQGIVPVILVENKEDFQTTQDLNVQWNISITAHHPVIVKHLGLHKAVIFTDEPIKVVLFDERREVDIVSVRFSSFDPGTLRYSYRFQAVESFILPRDFIGSVRIYQPTKAVQINQSKLMIDKKDFYGLISVDYLDELEIPFTPTNLSVDLLTFQAEVYDTQSLNSIITSKDRLNKDNQLKNSLTELKLRKENEKYGDLIFVNVTDYYRNLPQKLLEFHRWASISSPSEFVFKTDDDCYVDLEKVIASLKKFRGLDKIWWSSFRENWVVERFGKWEERTFRSSLYPTFACGSGNIVSRDISGWIARNADDLHAYQGEDVSMGIWLSAISVNYIFDNKWKCDKNCDNYGYVVPELSVDEMKLFWKNKQLCGNPCSCS